MFARQSGYNLSEQAKCTASSCYGRHTVNSVEDLFARALCIRISLGMICVEHRGFLDPGKPDPRIIGPTQQRAPDMAFRFRRTIRLAPGIRLNISKSGISASLGPRGASVTIGKRGIYANTGIPGTGMSYRTRLDKKALGQAETLSKVPSAKKAKNRTSANVEDEEAAAEDNQAASKRLEKVLLELKAFGQLS